MHCLAAFILRRPPSHFELANVFGFEFRDRRLPAKKIAPASNPNTSPPPPSRLSMPTDIKVVDISDPSKIKELLEEERRGNAPRRDSVDDLAVTDGESDPDDDEDMGRIARLLFSTFSTLTYLVPLTSVHIALDIIVHQQYAQDVDAVEIAARAGTAALGKPPSPSPPNTFYLGGI